MCQSVGLMSHVTAVLYSTAPGLRYVAMSRFLKNIIIQIWVWHRAFTIPGSLKKITKRYYENIVFCRTHTFYNALWLFQRYHTPSLLHLSPF